MPRTPEENRPYMKAYYAANKEVLLAKQSAYQKERLLGPEGDHVRELRCERVRASRRRKPEEWHRWNRESWARIKAEMIAAYGRRCACCGETAPAFLTLDHINRDGKQHRAQFGGRGIATSKQIYADLKRRGWPQDAYRILCMNCNFATRYGQPCPHQALTWVDTSEDLLAETTTVNCDELESSFAGS